MDYVFLAGKNYFLMNKPCGYVCSAVSDSHHTVYELLPSELQLLVKNPVRGKKLHTVGRLDADTSGLLLFTDDGYFSNFMTRSENHVEKTYEIRLKIAVCAENQAVYVEKCKTGFLIPAEKKGQEFRCKPSVLKWSDDFHCSLTIWEGKFHQVKRMIKTLGNEVCELKRVKFGDFELGNLKCGELIKIF